MIPIISVVDQDKRIKALSFPFWRPDARIVMMVGPHNIVL